MQKHDNSAKPETLSREVSNNLIKLILNGTYPAGSKLPTERDMAGKYNVARHIVREALKRLETLHLIIIRQGSGAIVQDVSLCGGIELVELENGTPDSVDKLVKSCMAQAKAGGGYMILPTACPINEQLSPKTEQNYYAFINAALKYGKY